MVGKVGAMTAQWHYGEVTNRPKKLTSSSQLANDNETTAQNNDNTIIYCNVYCYLEQTLSQCQLPLILLMCQFLVPSLFHPTNALTSPILFSLATELKTDFCYNSRTGWLTTQQHSLLHICFCTPLNWPYFSAALQVNSTGTTRTFTSYFSEVFYTSRNLIVTVQVVAAFSIIWVISSKHKVRDLGILIKWQVHGDDGDNMEVKSIWIFWRQWLKQAGADQNSGYGLRKHSDVICFFLFQI
jgi:hypothetical protein